MSPEGRDPLLDVQLAVGRIEVNLDAVKAQADGSTRTAEQLVGMMEERVMASVEALRERLDVLQASVKDTGETVKGLDRWRLTVTNRGIGILIGAGVGTSGLTAALVKVLDT